RCDDAVEREQCDETVHAAKQAMLRTIDILPCADGHRLAHREPDCTLERRRFGFAAAAARADAKDHSALERRARQTRIPVIARRGSVRISFRRLNQQLW